MTHNSYFSRLNTLPKHKQVKDLSKYKTDLHLHLYRHIQTLQSYTSHRSTYSR